ncbi:Acg family FMN-binding oxidoreductase [Dactylosporangium matsuzakiense]|uniref:NAD(P)H nitroreductase n=1 Tax=Dactylosporangium matsuzakiense TaxID=53360 RepID=A0A9W6KL97_9ACTN|nr:nitroreductase family protein [Dactylosporangium matsuzakiense]UWZ48313.1 nitroreductase family protein [Dactylosporangium matsuzakiense]GLL01554.1 NAD(P)H nitroreductase [Dactylosporangium matsuzakiense]
MTKPGRAEIDRIAEATIAALRAPSILNTQPWRWRLATTHGELWADRARQLPGLDPDGRLLLLSCGTALHHATAALRAAGYRAEIERRPDPARPDLIARLRQGSPIDPDDELYRAIYQRRTDRRPFADEPPAAAVVDELRAAAERHNVHLHVVPPDQLTALAAAVAHAGAAEQTDPGMSADVLTWTTRSRDDRDGVTARSLTAPGRRSIAPRNLSPARPPSLEPGPGQDRGTVYALLVTDADEPADWLTAGEALSDVWLTLTARGLAASPISEVIEVAPVRLALHRLLGGVGHPAIALRIGVPVSDADPVPPAVRRSGTDVIGLP